MNWLTRPPTNDEGGGFGPDVQARTRLLFRWSRRRWNWRLTFLIAVSLLGHFFAFYFFQVVYPPTQRVRPEPMRVTVLHPSNPIAAKVLREMDDRLFALTPGDSTELPEFSLSRPQTAFSPSFRDHDIPLKRIPHPEWSGEEAAPLVFGGVVLPPVISAPSAATAAAENTEQVIAVSSGVMLEGRMVTLDEAALPFSAKESDGRLRAQISVLPDGRIANLLIEDEPAGGLPADTAPRLQQAIRFERAPSAGLKWTWLELQW